MQGERRCARAVAEATAVEEPPVSRGATENDEGGSGGWTRRGARYVVFVKALSRCGTGVPFRTKNVKEVHACTWGSGCKCHCQTGISSPAARDAPMSPFQQLDFDPSATSRNPNLSRTGLGSRLDARGPANARNNGIRSRPPEKLPYLPLHTCSRLYAHKQDCRE